MSDLSNQLQQYLTSKGSPLASFAPDFIKAGQRYGVDPRFLVAIAGAETEFGKTGNAGAINNPFGWGPHIRFPNYSAAIDTIAKGLTTGPYYKTKGRTTIPQIGATWAPSGAANDPTNLNSNWTRNVSNVYRELGGNPGANVFSNSPSVSGPVNTQQQASVPVQLPDATKGVPALSWQKLYAMHQANQKDILAGRTPSPQRMQKLLGLIQGALPINIPQVPNAQVPGTPGAAPGVTAAGTALQQKAVKAAKSQLGVDYVWGGTDPREGAKDTKYGLDCSGLVQYAWRQAGVELPRITQQQIKVGRGIPANKPGAWQPGDLLFPHTGHVAMYVGDGVAIQAPRRGTKVSYFKVNTRKYIAVRRPSG